MGARNERGEKNWKNKARGNRYAKANEKGWFRPREQSKGGGGGGGGGKEKRRAKVTLGWHFD